MTDSKKVKIDADVCTGCSICIDECPTGALEMENGVSVLARPGDCTLCGNCEDVCPVSAITIE
ncbi:MAG: 4Fe-4S binding protein [Elusimicrobia bacterium]|nr:4Fe-4S binding protein [Elusimicrobiota bacterium]